MEKTIAGTIGQGIQAGQCSFCLKGGQFGNERVITLGEPQGRRAFTLGLCLGCAKEVRRELNRLLKKQIPTES